MKDIKIPVKLFPFIFYNSYLIDNANKNLFIVFKMSLCTVKVK